MDNAIIAAIIGSVTAIVVALINAKAGASRDRKKREAWDQAAAVLGKRVSTAEEPEERAFLEDNLELLKEVEAPTRSRLKRAEITICPGEQNLAFVVQKDNPRPAFNVMTRVTNGGQQVGIVDGLETILTGPEGVTFRFVWNLFYGYQRGGLLHTMSSYIHPVAVAPDSSRLLGIQFIGPDFGIENLYSWPTGRYQCEMTGWVNRRPDHQPVNLRSKFYIRISSMDIARLKEWVGWDDAAWARFPHPDYPDPDKAAGHPVQIVPG